MRVKTIATLQSLPQALRAPSERKAVKRTISFLTGDEHDIDSVGCCTGSQFRAKLGNACSGGDFEFHLDPENGGARERRWFDMGCRSHNVHSVAAQDVSETVYYAGMIEGGCIEPVAQSWRSRWWCSLLDALENEALSALGLELRSGYGEFVKKPWRTAHKNECCKLASQACHSAFLDIAAGFENPRGEFFHYSWPICAKTCDENVVPFRRNSFAHSAPTSLRLSHSQENHTL